MPERYLRPDPEVKTADNDKNDLPSESGEKAGMDCVSDDSDSEAESSEKEEEKEEERGGEEKEEEKEKKHGPSFYSLATDWLK